MRFDRRQQCRTGGGVPAEKGGFSQTPPASPPYAKPLISNALNDGKGELGGFSSSLHTRTNNQTRPDENISNPGGALGKVSRTPPDPLNLPAMCLSEHHSSAGGVLRTKPPTGWLAHIEELRHLPVDILMGLQALRDEPAPNITRPEAWDEIVADAVTLAVDGWARRALALGWDPLELFGCAPDPEGDDDRLGVAASLRGRQVLRFTLDAAHVANGSTRWRLIRRDHLARNMVYLWEYGR